MRSRHVVPTAAALLTLTSALTACSGGSGGDTTPTASAATTATVTRSATGAPVTGTPTAASTPVPTTPAPGGSAGGGGSSSGPGLCTPTVMTFRLGAGGGAAGTSYQPLVATNASQQPCVTTGFPGVALLDSAGRQIAQAQRTTGGATPATIVVQPGQQVSALLRGASTGQGGKACPEPMALLLTLPDNTDSTRIVGGVPACADGVGIGPLMPGTTGQ